jgi:gpW
MTCPTEPSFELPTDPHERLKMFETALAKLSIGEQVAEVRHGEQFVRYSQGSVTYLEREVGRLRAICNKRTGITIERSAVVGRFR